jgi:uncharacterized protein YlxP (DUF503 family)
MFVTTISLTLFIHDALTLKDKRQIIKSILEKTRQKFNAATAEVGYQDQWQRSQLGIALVGNSPSYLESVRQELLKMIESQYPVEITECIVNNY